MTIDRVITEPGQRAVRVSSVVAMLACVLVLLAPALWNHYPLLQFDTGGYLARWYEGYLVPSRSTVFGLFLHAGEGLHFWPELVLQAACVIWIISLVLRVTGFASEHWHKALIVAGLSLVTALPFLTSTLLTDIFFGLGVLALYLLLFHRPDLGRLEQIGLFVLVAFAAASHSATLAVLLAVLACAVLASLLSSISAFSGKSGSGISAENVTAQRNPERILSRFRFNVNRTRSGFVISLLPAGGAITIGAAMLLATNFALSGQLAWTPGGFGIAFGRMLQDGIVKRYLDDHCPDAQLKLCPYRKELPTTADDFLWSYGIFNQLGRFDGLGAEMRYIVLHSLQEYPWQQIETALVATATQLELVATGYGTHDRIWHTYGIIKRFIPGEVPAMQHARQQWGELDFAMINRVHVPLALGSMVLALVLLGRAWILRDFSVPARLVAVVTVAVLANAFVCGALSGPHNRYGARIAWIVTFAIGIALSRAVGHLWSNAAREMRG